MCATRRSSAAFATYGPHAVADGRVVEKNSPQGSGIERLRSVLERAEPWFWAFAIACLGVQFVSNIDVGAVPRVFIGVAFGLAVTAQVPAPLLPWLKHGLTAFAAVTGALVTTQMGSMSGATDETADRVGREWAALVLALAIAAITRWYIDARSRRADERSRAAREELAGARHDDLKNLLLEVLERNEALAKELGTLRPTERRRPRAGLWRVFRVGGVLSRS